MKRLWGNNEQRMDEYKIPWWVACVFGIALEYSNIISQNTVSYTLTICLTIWGVVFFLPDKIIGGEKNRILQCLDIIILIGWGIISIKKDNDIEWGVAIALCVKIILEGGLTNTKMFENLYFFKLTALTIVIECWVNSITNNKVSLIEQAAFLRILILSLLFKRKEEISSFVMGLAGYGVMRFYGTQLGGVLIKGGIRNYNALTNAGILSLVLAFGGKHKEIPSILLAICMLTSHSVGAGIITGVILSTLAIMNAYIDKANLKTKAIIITIAVLISGIAYLNADYILNLLNRTSTLDGRTELWKTAIGFLKNNHYYPFGGNFWIERGSIGARNLGGSGTEHGHNAYIDGLTKWGWCYALLFIASIVVCAYQTNTNKLEKTILLVGIGLPICVQAPTGMIWMWGVVCCCASWWGTTGKDPYQKYSND